MTKAQDLTQKMLELSLSRIEDSHWYGILSKNKEWFVAKGNKTKKKYRVLPIYALTCERFSELLIDAMRSNEALVPLFYKDGKRFLQRLGGEVVRKEERSLKRYTQVEAARFIKLSRLEQKALYSGNPVLNYYQPETERLEESIRVYHLEGVWFDYSHVDQSHRSSGFTKEGLSKSIWKESRSISLLTNEPGRLKNVEGYYFGYFEKK